MPNQEIRVAVGSPSELRSTIWKFVVQGNEIYILSRMFGEDVKVSLHGSGRCQFSCTSHWVLKVPGRRNADRHRDRWAVSIPSGSASIHIYQVRIPQTELRRIVVEEDLSQVEWLDPPCVGTTVSLECYLTSPSASNPTLMATLPNPLLFALKRADDRWFVVMRYDAPLDGRSLDSKRQRACSIARAHGIEPNPDHRMVFLTGGVGEVHGLIELAPFSDGVARSTAASSPG
jgi:hypothetical protein